MSANKLRILIAAVAIATSFTAAARADDEPTFNLEASQDEMNKNPGKELSRQEVQGSKKRDNFDQDDDLQLDPNKRDFAREHVLRPPKFHGSKQQSNPDFTGQSMQPMEAPDGAGFGSPDGAAQPSAGYSSAAPYTPAPVFAPNDPDDTPAMDIAWDRWHQRVTAAIYDRFHNLAQTALMNSPALTGSLSFQVTRNGRIINIEMDQNSPSRVFNAVAYQAIQSLDGNMMVLAFPEGSQRLSVSKEITFSQNCGRMGFRYTSGDSESVRRR